MQKSTNRPCVALCAALAILFATPVAALSSSPQELFERAETLYRQLEVVDPAGQSGSWGRVADAFSDVASRFPDSPLASEALWRISWIYGRQARGGDAAAAGRQLQAYRDLVERYPASPHAPEALLRLAVEAEGEGGARAASLYARLLQSYSSTPQAALARNRMAEVRRANPELEAPADAPRTSVPAVPAAATKADAPLVEPAPVAAETPLPDDYDADAADLARLTGVRHYSDPAHTRVVLDLDRPVLYSTGAAHRPERLFIDLQGVGKPGSLAGADVNGAEQVIAVSKAVSRVRVGQNRPGVVRVVIDLAGDARYTLFTLDNDGEPFRVVIDVPTATVASRLNDARRPPRIEGDSITEQLGLGVRRVVIDPGHGGTDPGAIGRTGATEKQLTLELSKMLAGRLRAAGYEVLLTREDDRTISLQERTDFANRVDADLFLSVHINSARNRNLRGFETYYLDLANDPAARETAARENASGQGGSMADLGATLQHIVNNEFRGASSELAASIQDSLVMHVSKSYQTVHDLGVKTAPFSVLVGAKMPAVLIETSFVSNEQEEGWLKTTAYRSQLAEAIEIGLQAYVEKRKVMAAAGR
jgi:N-acetylmuramoyl-L-alanine amidase